MATIKQLEAKLAALEAQLAEKTMNQSNSMLSELSQIDKRGGVQSDRIEVRPIHDHKNVSLYHTNGHSIGKRVGPLHPHNAKVELERFARRGIILAVKKPTDEAIAAYKETDEWKKLDKAFQKKRLGKIKTRKNNDIDSLAKAISKMSGQPIVNSISPVPVN